MQYLQRRFETQHMRITVCEKEDLELPNHLSGLKHKFLKLAFSTYVLPTGFVCCCAFALFAHVCDCAISAG